MHTHLAEARAAAHALRGEWLAAVREGLITPEDVIARSQEPELRALRTIRLSTLLAAAGLSSAQAGRLLTTLTAVTGTPATTRNRLTVAWLTDQRSGGRRLITYANLRRPMETPWPGFPYTPKPTPRSTP